MLRVKMRRKVAPSTCRTAPLSPNETRAGAVTFRTNQESRKDAIDKIVIMANLNWRAVLSMCTEHDPDSRFPGSECKNIEGFGFYDNFKIQKRQLVRGGNKKMQIPSCPRHI
jgi:hypothetical protein